MTLRVTRVVFASGRSPSLLHEPRLSLRHSSLLLSDSTVVQRSPRARANARSQPQVSVVESKLTHRWNSNAKPATTQDRPLRDEQDTSYPSKLMQALPMHVPAGQCVLPRTSTISKSTSTVPKSQPPSAQWVQHQAEANGENTPRCSSVILRQTCGNLPMVSTRLVRLWRLAFTALLRNGAVAQVRLEIVVVVNRDAKTETKRRWSTFVFSDVKGNFCNKQTVTPIRRVLVVDQRQ